MCGAPGSYVEDHDHESGLTRGFLCASCNGQEPNGGDRFGRYRAANPASILGLTIPYCGMFAEPLPGNGEGVDDSYVLAGRYGQRAET